MCTLHKKKYKYKYMQIITLKDTDMNLSLVLFIYGILGLNKKVRSTLENSINIIFFMFNYISKILIIHIIYIFFVCIIISNNLDFVLNVLTTIDVYITINLINSLLHMINLYTYILKLSYVISQYLDLCLMLTLAISVFILFYIKNLDTEFSHKYPILYKLLFIISIYLVAVIALYFLAKHINYICELWKMFKLWMDSTGYLSKGKQTRFDSPGTSGSGGPGEPGGSGGGGGNNMSSPHNTYNKKSRSNSESSDNSSSSSVYSDIIHEGDTEQIKNKKFCNCLYDMECDKYGNGELPNRNEFDNSYLNPMNWSSNGSNLNKRLASELQARIVYVYYKRKDINTNLSVEMLHRFNLDELGIGEKHPLRASINRALYPNANLKNELNKNTVVFSEALSVTLLKTIRDKK